eukprot:gene14017-18559_t
MVAPLALEAGIARAKVNVFAEADPRTLGQSRHGRFIDRGIGAALGNGARVRHPPEIVLLVGPCRYGGEQQKRGKDGPASHVYLTPFPFASAGLSAGATLGGVALWCIDVLPPDLPNFRVVGAAFVLLTVFMLAGIAFPRGDFVLVIGRPGTDEARMMTIVAAAGGTFVSRGAYGWLAVAHSEGRGFASRLIQRGALLVLDHAASYGTLAMVWVNVLLLAVAGMFSAGGFSLPAIVASIAIAAL